MSRVTIATSLFAICMATPPVPAHEGHSPYDAPGILWQLIDLNDKPYEAQATLEFPEIGRIQGQAPCNRFFGEMWAAYPWFKLDGVAATRRACPDLEAESLFFTTLQQMSLAEHAEGYLILTGDDGQVMVFKPVLTGG